tara:strand:+ start:2579 stop:3379 length:801 start_codon:yes stop_codon:yes gene_type:complete
MSRVRSDKYVNKAGTGAPLFPEGAVVTGVLTATSFDGTVGNATGLTGSPSITVTDITANGNVSIAGTLTYEDVNNIDSVGLITARRGIDVTGSGIFVSSGVVTATSFSGDGSGLSGVVSGIELKQAGASVGTSLTAVNFIGATLTAGSAGISTVTIASAGLSTEAYSPVGGIVTLDLSNQDHKVTATGICTITVTGGTEGDSHTVRIVNSGVSTVGFSTYFLFPSGASPSLSTGDTDINLVSFTVHREGSIGISTQLLTGVSLNFS